METGPTRRLDLLKERRSMILRGKTKGGCENLKKMPRLFTGEENQTGYLIQAI